MLCYKCSSGLLGFGPVQENWRELEGGSQAVLCRSVPAVRDTGPRRAPRLCGRAGAHVLEFSGVEAHVNRNLSARLKNNMSATSGIGFPVFQACKARFSLAGN